MKRTRIIVTEVGHRYGHVMTVKEFRKWGKEYGVGKLIDRPMMKRIFGKNVKKGDRFVLSGTHSRFYNWDAKRRKHMTLITREQGYENPLYVCSKWRLQLFGSSEAPYYWFHVRKLSK